MQFQVPQFIEVEDKIFGPLTFKQFLFVLGGAGAAYLAYRALPLYAALPLILAAAGAGGALAFMQYNGRPLILALEHGFYYFLRSKLYLWNNERATSMAKEVQMQSAAESYIPRISDSKLKELSWSLDINERIALGTTTDDDRDHLLKTATPLRTVQSAVRQF